MLQETMNLFPFLCKITINVSSLKHKCLRDGKVTTPKHRGTRYWSFDTNATSLQKKRGGGRHDPPNFDPYILVGTKS